jgi:hypothetical protein
MATAQKRGFRFPWGNDGRRDAPEAPDHDDSVPEQTLAQRIGAVPDDIGRGPFDLATTAVADPPATEGLEATDLEPGIEDDTREDAEADVHAAVARPSAAASETDATPEPEPAAEAAPSAEARPEASPAANGHEPQPPARSAAPHAVPANAPSAWPERDRRTARPAINVAPTAPAPSAAPRRDNKLMTGLVRAMRDAAEVARAEAVAGLRSDAAERSLAIRAQSTATTANLRRAADGDIAKIRDWSKAEIARVREETEAMISARKVRLAGDTEDEGKAAEGRLTQLGAAVQAYEAETARFFDALLAEDDPARLAGLAERMPQAPALDGIVTMGDSAPNKPATEARSRAQKSRVPARSSQPRPRVEAVVGQPPSHGATDEAAEAADPGPEPADVQVADVPDAEATVAEAPVAEAHAAEAPIEPSTPEAPDALDAEAAAAAEAAALDGLEGHTQVITSGLAGVAAIAGFKAALVRSPGVSAVSVNAGSDGDVLYSVTHAGNTDIRDALRDLGTFQTRLIADDGATLVVVVHEIAA